VSGREEVAAFAVQVAQDLPVLQPIFDDRLEFMEGDVAHYLFFGSGGVTTGFDDLLDSDLAEAQRFLDYLAPGVRSRRLHLQDSSGNKYLYDFQTNEFAGLPKTLAKKVLNDPGVARAIAKAKAYLNVR
jgi:hypothetical protein